MPWGVLRGRGSLEILLQVLENVVDHLIHIVFRIIINIGYGCFNTPHEMVFVIQFKTQKDLAVVFANALILIIDIFVSLPILLNVGLAVEFLTECGYRLVAVKRGGLIDFMLIATRYP